MNPGCHQESCPTESRGAASLCDPITFHTGHKSQSSHRNLMCLIFELQMMSKPLDVQAGIRFSGRWQHRPTQIVDTKMAAMANPSPDQEKMDDYLINSVTNNLQKLTDYVKQDAEEEGNQEVPLEKYSSPHQRHHCGSRSPRISVVPPYAVPANIPTTNHNNWQAGLTTVRERNAAMFNNELMADVWFVVGQAPNARRIPSHRYVLATGSSVFYAMFYGGLADNQDEVHIPDVEPAAFLNLLKYLYCDKVELEADTVISTLYAAKKYIVPYLARVCVDYLETSLSARNACVLLSQSRLFEEPELTQRCWEVIDAQAEESLQSDGFTDMDYDTLRTVLARETLNTSEMSLFAAAVRWAEAECHRRDTEPTAENKRQVLGDALYNIRLPTMKLEEFANSAAQSGILTLQETTDIFLYFTAQHKPRVNFVSHPRRGLAPHRVHRFQSSEYRSNQWRYRGRCDSIQFSADRRIFIGGFGLYGSSNGAAEYKVKIELKQNGVVLGHRNTRFFSDGSSSTFPVFFENPIKIDPEKFYTASAILHGAELSYFGQEGMAEVVAGPVTFQFQCSTDSTNGTGVQGGQIPELIFYC